MTTCADSFKLEYVHLDKVKRRVRKTTEFLLVNDSLDWANEDAIKHLGKHDEE